MIANEIIYEKNQQMKIWIYKLMRYLKKYSMN